MAYLRKTKAGWQININYTDPATGKRKRKTKVVNATKPEAEYIMADMIKEYNNSNPISYKDITFERWLQEWLDEKKKNVAYRTWQGYESIVRVHLIPTMGKIKLSDIKPYHITKYLAEKRENGRINSEGGLSERSLNYHYTTINNSLQQAFILEIIKKNPCVAVKAPRPDTKKRDMNVLTFEEVNMLLDKLKRSWLYPIIFLAINTGMRRGEICALKWEDINFFNQIISVKRSLYREKGEGLKEKSTKRKSSDRAIDFGSDVKILLESQYKKLEQIRGFSDGYNKNNYVFTMPEGHPIDPDYLTGKYSDAISQIKIKKHTFHDLRHTHVSLMLQAYCKNGGGDEIMKILQERLGHSTIKTTMDTYGHLMAGMQKKAADLLEMNLKTTK